MSGPKRRNWYRQFVVEIIADAPDEETFHAMICTVSEITESSSSSSMASVRGASLALMDVASRYVHLSLVSRWVL